MLSSAWENYIIPAPTIVSLLGQLTALTAGRDFSINKGRPKTGFKRVKQPTSFAAVMLQIGQEAGNAFEHAELNMKMVLQLMMKMPQKLKLIDTQLGMSNFQAVSQTMGIEMQHVKSIVKKAQALTTSISAEFDFVTALIEETVVATAKTKKMYDKDIQAMEDRLRNLKENEDNVEFKKQQLEKREKRLDSRLKEATHSYSQALKRIPSTWTKIAVQCTKDMVKVGMAVGYLAATSGSGAGAGLAVAAQAGVPPAEAEAEQNRNSGGGLAALATGLMAGGLQARNHQEEGLPLDEEQVDQAMDQQQDSNLDASIFFITATNIRKLAMEMNLHAKILFQKLDEMKPTADDANWHNDSKEKPFTEYTAAPVPADEVAYAHEQPNAVTPDYETAEGSIPPAEPEAKPANTNDENADYQPPNYEPEAGSNYYDYPVHANQHAPSEEPEASKAEDPVNKHQNNIPTDKEPGKGPQNYHGGGGHGVPHSQGHLQHLPHQFQHPSQHFQQPPPHFQHPQYGYQPEYFPPYPMQFQAPYAPAAGPPRGFYLGGVGPPPMSLYGPAQGGLSGNFFNPQQIHSQQAPRNYRRKRQAPADYQDDSKKEAEDEEQDEHIDTSMTFEGLTEFFLSVPTEHLNVLLDTLPDLPPSAELSKYLTDTANIAKELANIANERRAEEGQEVKINEAFADLDNALLAFAEAELMMRGGPQTGLDDPEDLPVPRGTRPDPKKVEAKMKLHALQEAGRAEEENFRKKLSVMEKLGNVQAKIARLDYRKKEYTEFIKIMKEGMIILSSLKEEWTKLGTFFSTIGNYVNQTFTVLHEQVDGRVLPAYDGYSKDESIARNLRRQVISIHTAKMKESAYNIAILSLTYMKVSQKYIVPPLHRLARGLTVPRKQRPRYAAKLRATANEATEKIRACAKEAKEKTNRKKEKWMERMIFDYSKLNVTDVGHLQTVDGSKAIILACYQRPVHPSVMELCKTDVSNPKVWREIRRKEEEAWKRGAEGD